MLAGSGLLATPVGEAFPSVELGSDTTATGAGDVIGLLLPGVAVGGLVMGEPESPDVAATGGTAGAATGSDPEEFMGALLGAENGITVIPPEPFGVTMRLLSLTGAAGMLAVEPLLALLMDPAVGFAEFPEIAALASA